VIERTFVWRRLDEPGMEVVHVGSFSRATGTQIGRTYEARWHLAGDRLAVDVNGERHRTIELGDADFFDLFASPFFNSLPVVRDGLLEPGPPRDYVMRFVTLPELDVVTSSQRYEPQGDRRVRYSSGSFVAAITFDAKGLVLHYEGFLERVWPRDP
jgi:hypothetical protein